MSQRVSLQGPRALAGLLTLFSYHGVIIGVCTASIALIRDRLGLDTIQIAGLFVTIGVVAVTTMQFAARITDKYGARWVCLVMILPLMAAATGYGLASTFGLLLVAGALLGMGNAGLDVSMNSLAVQVERHRLHPTPDSVAEKKGPIMSFLHGIWAIGAFLGSLGVSLTGTAGGLSPLQTLRVSTAAAAGLGIIIWVVAFIVVPQTEPIIHTTSTGEKTPIPRAAFLMGIMALCFGIGGSSTWTGPHVQTVAHVDPRTAVWAVTAVTACQVIVRLSGDRLVTLFGRRAVIRTGGVIASIGFLTAAFATPFPVLIAAWAMVGLGTGVIAPQVYASAGHLGGARCLAVVASFSQMAFLIGPAIIGVLAHFTGLGHAMVLPGLLLIVAVTLVGIAIKNDYSQTPGTPKTPPPVILPQAGPPEATVKSQDRQSGPSP
ncbi:MAG: MFS transporter [Propionibacteriaceae bacterium]|nr:MFS transporter [Propionibacteriaceae bacterium]